MWIWRNTFRGGFGLLFFCPLVGVRNSKGNIDKIAVEERRWLMADWQSIKTEYITTDTSYRKLAQKYGIDSAVIGRRAKSEEWVKLRQQHIDKTQTKTLDAISKKQVDRAAKLIAVSDLLLDKIKSLAEDFPELLMVPQNMKHISGVLKDIKDIQMIKSDADMREQEARIEKLRREAEPEKHTDAPKLVVEGLPEEFKV
jgi:tRNA-dihydrouridine synthase